MLNVALPKGRLGDKVYRLFKAAGYDCAAMEQDDRRLVLTDEKGDMSYLLVKPSDVAIYVEHGAADVGVVGKDVLSGGRKRCIRAAGPGLWQMPHGGGRARGLPGGPPAAAARGHQVSGHRPALLCRAEPGNRDHQAQRLHRAGAACWG